MRRMLAIVCTAATVLLAGCDSEATTVSTGGNAVSGTWNLTTVNGAALPFVIQSTPKIELVSEQLLVSANGTFTQASQVRTTSGTTVSTQTLSSGGTYTLSGTTASFIFNDGTTGAGTVSGNSLTVAKPGRSYVYDKP